MAKGHQANKERLMQVSQFGKSVSKRAGFRCEWCEGNDDLRVWDYRPDLEPEESNLALLCAACREMADGRSPDPNRLKSIRNALWSDIPAVSEGSARVLVRSRESWVREAIEESLISDVVKQELLG